MLKTEITYLVDEIFDIYNISFPVDLHQLADNLRINVIEMDLDLEGYFINANNMHTIFLNSRGADEGRKRFTFAHEIGHSILHVDSPFLDLNCEKEKYFRYHRELKTVENEADFFAAEILLPTKIIIDMLPNKTIDLSTIKKIATQAQTSMLSTAIKCVINSKTENELLLFFAKDDEIKWFCSANSDWVFQQMPSSFDGLDLFTSDYFKRIFEIENYVVLNYGRVVLLSGETKDISSE